MAQKKGFVDRFWKSYVLNVCKKKRLVVADCKEAS